MGRATILEFGSSQDGVDGVGGGGALLARRQRRPALQGVRRVRRRVPDLPPQLRRRVLQQLQSLFPAKCTGWAFCLVETWKPLERKKVRR